MRFPPLTLGEVVILAPRTVSGRRRPRGLRPFELIQHRRAQKIAYVGDVGRALNWWREAHFEDLLQARTERPGRFLPYIRMPPLPWETP